MRSALFSAENLEQESDQPGMRLQNSKMLKIGRRTGEAFTMSFAGQGFVVVQPSEELPAGLAGAGGGQQQSKGLLGGLLD